MKESGEFIFQPNIKLSHLFTELLDPVTLEIKGSVISSLPRWICGVFFFLFLGGVQSVPTSDFFKQLKMCSLCKQTLVALVTGNTATQAMMSLGQEIFLI